MITWNIYVLELQEKKSWKYSYLSWYGWNSVLINPKHYAKLTCYHPGNHCGKKKKKSTAGSNSSMSWIISGSWERMKN